MRSNKRYFYLKLREDFFQSETYQRLKNLPSGNEIILCYIQLEVISSKTDGILDFSSNDADFVDSLASVTGQYPDVIFLTIQMLERLNLIEKISEKEYVFPEVKDLSCSITESSLRSRKSRSKVLHCNTQFDEIDQNDNLDAENDDFDPECVALQHTIPREENEEEERSKEEEVKEENINIYSYNNYSTSLRNYSNQTKESKSKIYERNFGMLQSNAPDSPKTSKIASSRQQAKSFLESWNSTEGVRKSHGIPANSKRYSAFQARVADYGFEGLMKGLEEISKSDFLRGRCEPRDGYKRFKVDMDWFLRPNNFLKVFEGRYRNPDEAHVPTGRPKDKVFLERIEDLCMRAELMNSGVADLVTKEIHPEKATPEQLKVLKDGGYI